MVNLDGLTALAADQEGRKQTNGTNGGSPPERFEAKKLEPWGEPEPISPTLQPVETLPAEIIPGPFRHWLIDTAHRMQAPLDFMAAAILVVVASIIGALCGIRPKQFDDWLVVTNLWGGVIAPPSMLKTPSLAEVMKPLGILEARAAEEYDTAMRGYDAEYAIYKATKDALQGEMRNAASGKKAKNGKPLSMDELKDEYSTLVEPDKPTRRRYKTNDSTIEKTGEILNGNPAGILLFRDELMGWLASLDQENRAADRAFYLEAWNGYGRFTTDRIGRGTIDVKNMCISVLGGIQPAKLMAYLYQANDALQNDGLMQRMQVLVYPDEPEKWELVDRSPDIDAKNKAYAVIYKLADMDFMQVGAERDSGDEDGIPYFRFSSEAQGIFNEWLTDLQTKKLRADDNPALIEHLAKYRSLMPAIALIVHLINIADGGPEGPVSEEAAIAAAIWADYLESHARRIYGLVGGMGQRAAAELAKKITKGTLKSGFTVWDIYHEHGWHLLDTKERAQQAVDELVASGWLRAVPIEVRGRQPKVGYEINPKIIVKND